MSYNSGSESDYEEPTLADIRQGREPIWTFIPHGAPDVTNPTFSRACKFVRCIKHLPETAKAKLESDQDRDDPQWFPPQYIMLKEGWWSDQLISSVICIDTRTGKCLEYGDKRPCGVCAFEKGINKVRSAIYKRKFFHALEGNWITPNAYGYCGYAEWSWRKMKAELEGDGVQF